jgi:hypothetical protein
MGPPTSLIRESQRVLARILGLSPSLQAIESAVVEAGGDVTTFYDQPAAPAAPSPAAHPHPVDKELRATLAGKVDAMRHLAPRVAQRDGPHS